MDIPKQIKVAANIVDIESWPIGEAFPEGRYGDFTQSLLKIRVSDGTKLSISQNTLLHEVLHSIYHAYNMYSEDDEERTVTAMANGLIQVLQDNPALVNFLMDEEVDSETK